jgi:cell wall-associated NlpC family hydrolase
MSAVRAMDDGWAILALPSGSRDLGCMEIWEDSLARSRRRREAASMRRSGLTTRRIATVLVTAAVVAPAGGQVAFPEPAAATAARVTSDLLRMGSRGAAVSAAQRALGIPADGVFGKQTRRAVRAFQRSHGLQPDGVIGPVTRQALRLGGAAASAPATGAASPTVALQRALGIPADGEYGPVTRAAVRRFQQSHGLTADGVAGARTLAALGIKSAATLGIQRLSAAESGPAASSGAAAAIAAARAKIGTPYASAGNGPNGFDCSGLTVWTMRAAGVSLPRSSYAQYGVGRAVSRGDIQPGDLVFFNTNGPGASHVGVATSGSTVISATTRGVMEHSISDSYWGSHYVGARRVA